MMNTDNDSKELITTEVKFSLSGQREAVYAILEQMRAIISNVNTSEDDVQIIVEANTSDMAIETHDGHFFEDQATMIKWEELQEKDVDINAMVLLNRTQMAVENQEISTDVLKKNINCFADIFLPKLLQELVSIIQLKLSKKAVEVDGSIVDESKRDRGNQMVLGQIDILLDTLNQKQNTQETKLTVVTIIEEFFKSKGISSKIIKNINLNILENQDVIELEDNTIEV